MKEASSESAEQVVGQKQPPKHKYFTCAFGIDHNLIVAERDKANPKQIDFKLYYTSSHQLVASVYFLCREEFDPLHYVTTKYPRLDR